MLREEIAKLEAEVRVQRDQVADIQVENRNLSYVLEREQEAIMIKDKLEHKALSAVGEDLEEQLSQLTENAEKLTGKVSPFMMEQILNKKMQKSNSQYEQYIKESQEDLEATDIEIAALEKELERERIQTESLQKHKAQNLARLNELTTEFQKYQNDLN